MNQLTLCEIFILSIIYLFSTNERVLSKWLLWEDEFDDKDLDLEKWRLVLDLFIFSDIFV